MFKLKELPEELDPYSVYSYSSNGFYKSKRLNQQVAMVSDGLSGIAAKSIYFIPKDQFIQALDWHNDESNIISSTLVANTGITTNDLLKLAAIMKQPELAKDLTK
jgi:hypothetical protein